MIRKIAAQTQSSTLTLPTSATGNKWLIHLGGPLISWQEATLKIDEQGKKLDYHPATCPDVYQWSKPKV